MLETMKGACGQHTMTINNKLEMKRCINVWQWSFSCAYMVAISLDILSINQSCPSICSDSKKMNGGTENKWPRGMAMGYFRIPVDLDLCEDLTFMI